MTYNLKAARARKKWTQAQAAKALGCSLRAYKYWEKNPSSIPALKVHGIRAVMTEKKLA